MAKKEFRNVLEACQFLQLPREEVERLAEEKVIPNVPTGPGGFMFKLDDLVAYKSSMAGGTSVSIPGGVPSAAGGASGEPISQTKLVEMYGPGIIGEVNKWIGEGKLEDIGIPGSPAYDFGKINGLTFDQGITPVASGRQSIPNPADREIGNTMALNIFEGNAAALNIALALGNVEGGIVLTTGADGKPLMKESDVRKAKEIFDQQAAAQADSGQSRPVRQARRRKFEQSPHVQPGHPVMPGTAGAQPGQPGAQVPAEQQVVSSSEIKATQDLKQKVSDAIERIDADLKKIQEFREGTQQNVRDLGALLEALDPAIEACEALPVKKKDSDPSYQAVRKALGDTKDIAGRVHPNYKTLVDNASLIQASLMHNKQRLTEINDMKEIMELGDVLSRFATAEIDKLKSAYIPDAEERVARIEKEIHVCERALIEQEQIKSGQKEGDWSSHREKSIRDSMDERRKALDVAKAHLMHGKEVLDLLRTGRGKPGEALVKHTDFVFGAVKQMEEQLFRYIKMYDEGIPAVDEAAKLMQRYNLEVRQDRIFATPAAEVRLASENYNSESLTTAVRSLGMIVGLAMNMIDGDRARLGADPRAIDQAQDAIAVLEQKIAGWGGEDEVEAALKIAAEVRKHHPDPAGYAAHVQKLEEDAANHKAEVDELKKKAADAEKNSEAAHKLAEAERKLANAEHELGLFTRMMDETDGISLSFIEAMAEGEGVYVSGYFDNAKLWSNLIALKPAEKPKIFADAQHLAEHGGSSAPLDYAKNVVLAFADQVSLKQAAGTIESLQQRVANYTPEHELVERLGGPEAVEALEQRALDAEGKVEGAEAGRAEEKERADSLAAENDQLRGNLAEQEQRAASLAAEREEAMASAAASQSSASEAQGGVSAFISAAGNVSPAYAGKTDLTGVLSAMDEEAKAKQTAIDEKAAAEAKTAAAESKASEANEEAESLRAENVSLAERVSGAEQAQRAAEAARAEAEAEKEAANVGKSEADEAAKLARGALETEQQRAAQVMQGIAAVMGRGADEYRALLNTDGTIKSGDDYDKFMEDVGDAGRAVADRILQTYSDEARGITAANTAKSAAETGKSEAESRASELESQKTELEQQLTEARDAAAALEQEKNALESNAGDNSEEAEQLRGRVAELEEQLAKLDFDRLREAIGERQGTDAAAAFAARFEVVVSGTGVNFTEQAGLMRAYAESLDLSGIQRIKEQLVAENLDLEAQLLMLPQLVSDFAPIYSNITEKDLPSAEIKTIGQFRQYVQEAKQGVEAMIKRLGEGLRQSQAAYTALEQERAAWTGHRTNAPAQVQELLDAQGRITELEAEIEAARQVQHDFDGLRAQMGTLERRLGLYQRLMPEIRAKMGEIISKCNDKRKDVATRRHLDRKEMEKDNAGIYTERDFRRYLGQLELTDMPTAVIVDAMHPDLLGRDFVTEMIVGAFHMHQAAGARVRLEQYAVFDKYMNILLNPDPDITRSRGSKDPIPEVFEYWGPFYGVKENGNDNFSDFDREFNRRCKEKGLPLRGKGISGPSGPLACAKRIGRTIAKSGHLISQKAQYESTIAELEERVAELEIPEQQRQAELAEASGQYLAEKSEKEKANRRLRQAKKLIDDASSIASMEQEAFDEYKGKLMVEIRPYADILRGLGAAGAPAPESAVVAQIKVAYAAIMEKSLEPSEELVSALESMASAYNSMKDERDAEKSRADSLQAEKEELSARIAELEAGGAGGDSSDAGSGASDDELEALRARLAEIEQERNEAVSAKEEMAAEREAAVSEAGSLRDARDSLLERVAELETGGATSDDVVPRSQYESDLAAEQAKVTEAEARLGEAVEASAGAAAELQTLRDRVAELEAAGAGGDSESGSGGDALDGHTCIVPPADDADGGVSTADMVPRTVLNAAIDAKRKAEEAKAEAEGNLSNLQAFAATVYSTFGQVYNKLTKKTVVSATDGKSITPETIDGYKTEIMDAISALETKAADAEAAKDAAVKEKDETKADFDALKDFTGGMDDAFKQAYKLVTDDDIPDNADPKDLPGYIDTMKQRLEDMTQRITSAEEQASEAETARAKAAAEKDEAIVQKAEAESQAESFEQRAKGLEEKLGKAEADIDHIAGNLPAISAIEDASALDTYVADNLKSAKGAAAVRAINAAMQSGVKSEADLKLIESRYADMKDAKDDTDAGYTALRGAMKTPEGEKAVDAIKDIYVSKNKAEEDLEAKKTELDTLKQRVDKIVDGLGKLAAADLASMVDASTGAANSDYTTLHGDLAPEVQPLAEKLMDEHLAFYASDKAKAKAEAERDAARTAGMSIGKQLRDTRDKLENAHEALDIVREHLEKETDRADDAEDKYDLLVADVAALQGKDLSTLRDADGNRTADYTDFRDNTLKTAEVKAAADHFMDAHCQAYKDNKALEERAQKAEDHIAKIGDDIAKIATDGRALGEKPASEFSQYKTDDLETTEGRHVADYARLLIQETIVQEGNYQDLADDLEAIRTKGRGITAALPATKTPEGANMAVYVQVVYNDLVTAEGNETAQKDRADLLQQRVDEIYAKHGGRFAFEKAMRDHIEETARSLMASDTLAAEAMALYNMAETRGRTTPADFNPAYLKASEAFFNNEDSLEARYAYGRCLLGMEMYRQAEEVLSDPRMAGFRDADFRLAGARAMRNILEN